MSIDFYSDFYGEFSDVSRFIPAKYRTAADFLDSDSWGSPVNWTQVWESVQTSAMTAIPEVVDAKQPDQGLLTTSYGPRIETEEKPVFSFQDYMADNKSRNILTNNSREPEPTTWDEIKAYLNTKENKGLLGSAIAGGTTLLGAILQGKGQERAAETTAQNNKELFNMKVQAEKEAEQRLLDSKKVTVGDMSKSVRRPRITKVGQPFGVTR